MKNYFYSVPMTQKVSKKEVDFNNMKKRPKVLFETLKFHFFLIFTNKKLFFLQRPNDTKNVYKP